MSDANLKIETSWRELAEARQQALDASQEAMVAAQTFIRQLQQIVTDQRATLDGQNNFIAHQDQLIRFQSLHLPAGLEYPAPFDAMMKAQRAS